MYQIENFFAPSIGPPGLSIFVEAGVLLVSGSSVILPSQTVTLTANSTNYVYLNTSTAVVTSNTSGFPSSNCYPLATVVTGTTGVVSLTDNRSDVTGSGGGGGGVTSVGTAGIATGGPITTTGTVTVAGSGNTTTAATAAANVHGAPSGDVVTTDGSGNVQDSGTLLSSLAPLASPAFTGVPTAPTAGASTNTTQLATTAFVKAQGYGTGTVTSVGTSGIATGGAITTTGTVTVAGSGNTTTAATAAANLAAAASGNVVSTDGSGNVQSSGTLLSSLAPLASPTFTGTPAAPTAGGGTNTTQLATTAFVQNALGPGAILWNNLGNAAGNLQLSNAAFTTTFNQTSAAAWLWANTTIATSGTTNASPTPQLAANYWTGAASAADTWTIGSSLTAGTNGASTLSLAHAGSTGNAAVQVPAGTLGTAGAWGLTFAGTTVGLAATAANTVAILGTGPSLRFYNGATNQGEVGTQSASSIAALGAHLQTTPANTSIIVAGNIGTTINVVDVLIGGQTAHTGTSAVQTGVSIGNGTSAGAGFLSFSPTSGTANFVAAQVFPVINQTSTSSGNYTGLLVNVVETALKGSANKLLDLQAGTTGGTSKFTVSNSGAVTNYKGTATVRNGVPAEYASSDLVTQSAAITATTLISAPATGAYRVSWSATITTPDGAASVLGGAGGFQVLYTSPTDSVVKTTVSGAGVTSAANTTGTAVGGCLTIYAKTGTNIQYTYGYTSTTPGQMVYELHITVEAL